MRTHRIIAEEGECESSRARGGAGVTGAPAGSVAGPASTAAAASSAETGAVPAGPAAASPQRVSIG